MPTVRSIHRPILLVLALGLALSPFAPGAAHAQGAVDPPIKIGDNPAALRRAKQEILLRELMRERRERLERAAELRREAKHKARGRKGERVRPETRDFLDPQSVLPVRVALPAGVSTVNAIPTNVKINDKTGDAANAGQAEENIAILGNFGFCNWNNGQGFVSGGDIMSAGYSTDGGATWASAGVVPKPAGGTQWTSDPVIAVNEKTSTFWFAGLINYGTTNNGVAIVPATFPGGVFTWGTPRTVRNVPNSQLALDKEWIAADSSNGNLYATYTSFGASDSILFQRSTDGGVTWSAPILMNTSPGSFGNVQGSRPVVGPNGEVYVVWYEIGPIDADFMKIRKSVNGGLTFGTEAVAGTAYMNFGTGSPGFNRDHGITFPAIAVDRSSGPHRGRVYVSWNETVNWYDDPLGGGGTVAEAENNGTTATANAFTPGQKLTGAISSGTDLDYFKFNATAGTNYIFFLQTAGGSTLKYTFRVYCTDGTTRLANGGDNNVGGGYGYIVWTAPTTDTYYLRVGGVSNTGTYTVFTGVDIPSAGEHARDMDDAMVSWSDNGTSWSAQVRANDDVALYANYMPEVAVSPEGYAYSLWNDYRNSPVANCGGVADTWITRSTDGGASWAANQRLSSVSTNFTTAAVNIAPNMGDYNAIYGGPTMPTAWADGRLGDVDVWGASLALLPTLACPSGPTVNAGTPFNLTLGVTNPNLMFANDYTVALTSDHPSWTITPSSQPLTLGSLGSSNVTFSVTAPDTSPSIVGVVCFNVAALGGGQIGSCCVQVPVIGTLGVPSGPVAAFALHGAWPNPATVTSGITISFSLPAAAPATLELLDMNGRRIAGREVGGLGAGNHVVSFQRESAGLPAGIYVVRLAQGGRQLSAKVALVR